MRRWVALASVALLSGCGDAASPDAGTVDAGPRTDGGAGPDADTGDAGPSETDAAVTTDAEASADAGPPPGCFAPIVLGGGGIPFGLGVAPGGAVALAHHASGGHLGVSTNAGGAPWAQVLRSDDIVQRSWADVALDDLGHVHVVYYGYHATNHSGSWVTEEWVTSAKQALVTAPDGTIHSAGIGTGGGLAHVLLGAGVRTETPIASHGAEAIDIAVDSAGRPLVAGIADEDRDGTNELMLFRRDDAGAWSSEIVPVLPSRSYPVRLAVAPDDVAYLLHGSVADTGSALVLTRHAATTTTEEIVDSAVPDYDVAIANDGTPHVVWGYFNIGVWHAARAGGAWVRTRVEDTYLEGMLTLDNVAPDEVRLTYAGQYERARQVRQMRVCP